MDSWVDPTPKQRVLPCGCREGPAVVDGQLGRLTINAPGCQIHGTVTSPPGTRATVQSTWVPGFGIVEVEDVTLELDNHDPTPFDLTPEQEAVDQARDAERQRARVEVLLLEFLPVFAEEMGKYTLSRSSWNDVGRALLTWMDDVKYDPWGNLASLEQQGEEIRRLKVDLRHQCEANARLQAKASPDAAAMEELVAWARKRIRPWWRRWR